MPITLTTINESLRVKALRGKDEIIKYLQNLGFIEGAEVSIVSECDGCMIIRVYDSRIALDKKMARCIMV
jgi:ferrous iron transport protein A